MAIDQMELEKRIQSERDKNEIKLTSVVNGWLLKTRKGWYCYNDFDKLMAAVQEAVKADAPPRGGQG